MNLFCCPNISGKSILCSAVFLFVDLFACTTFAELVELRTAKASCLVDIDGSRVVSFRVGEDELLWNDSPPQVKASDWAHGGIPICWPNFGVDSYGVIHGVAWRKRFKILMRRESRACSTLVLELKEGDARVKSVVTLTDTLTLEMITENHGTNEYRCSYGYHPYFQVGERNGCSISGIDGFLFDDDPSVVDCKSGVWHGDVVMTNDLDRIFVLPKMTQRVFTLRDTMCSRLIEISCEGASHLNVWNPGAAKNCPGIVPGDEWRRFVCVEPIALAFEVPPGGKKTLKMIVEVKEI